jgi:hypothetical protein
MPGRNRFGRLDAPGRWSPVRRLFEIPDRDVYDRVSSPRTALADPRLQKSLLIKVPL